MPLTEKGYERPTFDDLVAAQEARARQLFGDDIDTNDNTPLGKYIRLNVKDLADVYELLEMIYYARFPHTATGASLDRLCPFAGIARNQATYAQHLIRFYGTAGEYVPAAFEVSTADGTLLYHLYTPLLIGEDGTAEGIVECDTAGEAGNVSIGKIDTIVNPSAHVERIEHLGIDLYGEEIESDTALRDRFDNAISGTGSATAAAISGAIARVALVDGVAVVENNTDETVDGIPPHSFECFVLSPESQDTQVAEAIFSKKPLGIKAVGDVSVQIIDDSGVTHTISFSRTKKTNIHIKLTINTDNYFESDGVEQIKSYIAQHINTLKNGADVYLSSIYGYIYKAAGVVNVSSLTMGTDGSTYGTSDIAINEDEVARIDTADIEVVVST